MPKRMLIIGLAMVSAAVAAHSYKPSIYLAAQKPKIDLEAQVPKAFGEWTLDNTIAPVLPDPQVQAKLDVLYSATLARTYRNAKGQRVMLSIAYGSDQSSEATAVHRPEFCYSAQGFKVNNLGRTSVELANNKLNVQRLLGVQGQRVEPITYWITLDETATLPGMSRKMEQIKYGLRGQIPDGMLFRISTIDRDPQQSFALQQAFLSELAAHMDPTLLPRYFGTSNAPL